MEEKELMKIQNVCVVEVKDSSEKCACTRKVLESLPEWFGIKEALDDYVVKAAEFPFWAALDTNNNCIGFFSAKTHYGHTGEIFVCGILPEYHHLGIGKLLYSKVEEYFIHRGCKYAIVETLSDIVDSKPYENTRRFYQSIGFEPLLTLTEMWDRGNFCLIMIKSLS